MVRRTTPMTGQLTLDDCMPDRPDPDPPPGDYTPSRFHVRQQEMHDLRDQHAGPLALWTAHTVPTVEPEGAPAFRPGVNPASRVAGHG